MLGRLAGAALTPLQVVAAWVKLARKAPAGLGEFPLHARMLYANLATVLIRLKRTFPNIRLAYLSSRLYAGYATTALNPEPYAYETAFAVRWIIQDQIAGRPELNCDPSRDTPRAPVALWGPYLWADGTTPRSGDGLVWEKDDLESDGTHPANSGRRKVAEMLLQFLSTHPTARPWFTGRR